MKIKQVEELVGITRKNIRFYEEQGLLNVERAENGYREYHTADIARLQEIKLFRKMDISIEEMRVLFEKRKSLQFCLEQHLGELERRREGLVKMQEMCERLIAEHQSLDTLNAENCLEEIEQMEKEGARFMDTKKTDIRKKRRTGAVSYTHLMEADKYVPQICLSGNFKYYRFLIQDLCSYANLYYRNNRVKTIFNQGRQLCNTNF